MLLSQRAYLWNGHLIRVDRAMSNNDAANQHEPSCETCSLPYVIAEAVKFMNRFGVSKLLIDDSEIKHLPWAQRA